jgi:hypothetical protein
LNAGRTCLATVLFCLFLVPTASEAKSLPTLGQPWSQNQQGYGEIKPRRIFNGGDPTGLVMHIHWKHWGAKRAWGWGTGIFVWPGTSVAEGIRARARVVAFHLGTCHGAPAYDAVQWFYPGYDETFHPGLHINDCSGRYAGFGYHPRHCRSFGIGRGAFAYEVTTLHLSCRHARTLVASSPAARYAFGGGRFIHRHFYCGTTGMYEGEPPAIFDCARDLRSVTFDVAFGD